VADAAPADERWISEVAAELQHQLRERGDGIEHGDPREVAVRMVATVPRRSHPLGAVMSTSGIARVLGGVTRQAVEGRRQRKTLIALKTVEGAWVYPAFQLDDHRRVVPAIVDAHVRLCRGRIDGWAAAAALLRPQPQLDGRSIVQHLREGGDAADCDPLLADAIGDWRSKRSSRPQGSANAVADGEPNGGIARAEGEH
jgi:hypothetical protein